MKLQSEHFMIGISTTILFSLDTISQYCFLYINNFLEVTYLKETVGN